MKKIRQNMLYYAMAMQQEAEEKEIERMRSEEVNYDNTEFLLLFYRLLFVSFNAINESINACSAMTQTNLYRQRTKKQLNELRSEINRCDYDVLILVEQEEKLKDVIDDLSAKYLEPMKNASLMLYISIKQELDDAGIENSAALAKLHVADIAVYCVIGMLRNMHEVKSYNLKLGVLERRFNFSRAHFLLRQLTDMFGSGVRNGERAQQTIRSYIACLMDDARLIGVVVEK